MSKIDPVVQARPHCLFCKKKLRPDFARTFSLAPRDKLTKFYGFGYAGRFCNKTHAALFALAVTGGHEDPKVSETQVQAELERGQRLFEAKQDRDEAKRIERRNTPLH